MHLELCKDEDILCILLNSTATDERSPTNAAASATAAHDPRPSGEPRLHYEGAEQDVWHDGLRH